MAPLSPWNCLHRRDAKPGLRPEKLPELPKDRLPVGKKIRMAPVGNEDNLEVMRCMLDGLILGDALLVSKIWSTTYGLTFSPVAHDQCLRSSFPRCIQEYAPHAHPCAPKEARSARPEYRISGMARLARVVTTTEPVSPGLTGRPSSSSSSKTISQVTSRLVCRRRCNVLFLQILRQIHPSIAPPFRHAPFRERQRSFRCR